MPTYWPHLAALAGCPKDYSPFDAALDLLLSIVRRVCNPDPSHRRHR